MIGQTYHSYRIEWRKGLRPLKAELIDDQNTYLREFDGKIVVIGHFTSESKALSWAQEYAG